MNIPSPSYSDRLHQEQTAPVDSDLMDVLDEMGNGELDDILDVLFGTYPFILDLLPTVEVTMFDLRPFGRAQWTLADGTKVWLVEVERC